MVARFVPFMKKRLLPILLLSALVCGAAQAEKADRNKPMNVEADALRYDDLQQTSVFTGKVVVTKGTIVIRGAQLDVRQDPEGYQYGVVTAEPGKRRSSARSAKGEPTNIIEGEGETIEYDGKADSVKFIRSRRDAPLCAARGLSDEISGAVITYDNTTDSSPSTAAARRLGQPAPVARRPRARRARAANGAAAGSLRLRAAVATMLGRARPAEPKK